MTDIVEEDISHRLANRVERSIALLEACGLDAKVTMTRDAALATADLLRAVKGMERSIQNLLDERATYHVALSSRDREIERLRAALKDCAFLLRKGAPCNGASWRDVMVTVAEHAEMVLSTEQIGDQG